MKLITVKGEIQSYLCFTFLIIVSSTFLNARSLVNFSDKSPTQIQSNDKKIYLSFTASWCLPCKLMDETLYSDPEIASLLNEHFVNIKADLDTPRGLEWKKLYDVKFLPTSLLIYEVGNETKRWVGVPTRNELLEVLTNSTKVMSSPIKETLINIVKSEADHSIITTHSKYVVQMGAFAKKENAERLLKKLTAINTEQPSIAAYYPSKGAILYRVLLNEYRNKHDALEALHAIRRKGFDGFIKRR